MVVTRPTPPHILHVHPKHLALYAIVLGRTVVRESILTDCWVPLGGIPVGVQIGPGHLSSIFLGTLLSLFSASMIS